MIFFYLFLSFHNKAASHLQHLLFNLAIKKIVSECKFKIQTIQRVKLNKTFSNHIKLLYCCFIMITVFTCQVRLRAEVSRCVNSTYSARGRGRPSHLIRSQAVKLVWTTATGMKSCIVMHQHSVVPKNFWNHYEM